METPIRHRGSIDNASVTTAFGFEDRRIVSNLGIVRGITVRSRSVIGNFGASFQIFFGGNISIYQKLCEQAREDAFRQMITHARTLGANAIIGMRYDANEIMGGVTEVLCYGTAVVTEPL